jgi:glycosyltransferase involved in cell wall biosynthesis
MHNETSEENPLVSVMIVTFNQRHLIAETIESVISQSYGNLQIVISDDGSVDGSQELIADYQRRDSRIFAIFSPVNTGITSNCNRAFRACTGRFLAFLGGDDIMLPRKIERQVALLLADETCAICYHDMDIFRHEDNATFARLSQWHKPRTGGAAVTLKYGSFAYGSSAMLRRSDAPVEGFDERYPVGSEWPFYVETLLRSGKNIRYINEVLARYRRHDGNVTRRTSSTVQRGKLDQVEYCASVAIRHPNLAADALYCMATLMRSERQQRNYLGYLVASLQCSVQWKALLLILVYVLSVGRVKR